ncbi:EAL domain-containing protein [Phosphitispora fastidiosa]|uniref:EAL domain-containing protein n=1 Tax=Phosphitispora fastidiosa TaxID=2837202 RepID=UPI001E2C8112|nr:EAL domain-containing protein [Phosphitispora fastidiosa]MBU7007658.1 diguanylate cyclase (GGDEF)-like protein/PAS domain S-box-containing protein [Phosphitispora fastidiosa]
MDLIIPSVMATLLGTILLTHVYWYLFLRYRERFMKIWAMSWTVYALRFTLELIVQFGTNGILIVAGQQFTTLASGLLFMWGTYSFLGKHLSRWPLYAVLVDGIWITAGFLLDIPLHILNLPTFLFLGLVYIWTGVMLLRSRDLEGLGRLFTGWGFVLWGIHKLNYPFAGMIPGFAPWGYLTAAVLEFVVATGILLVYLEKMRAVLSSGEARFRRLAENAQDIIYRCRLLPSRGFEYVSPAATDITGYTPEEYYADPDLLFKITHADDLDVLNVLPVLTVEQGKPVIMRTFRKDGNMVWTEHHTVPFYDETGCLVGFEGIARDITRRRQAEEELRKSEWRFREILENVRLLTVTLDKKGNITFCNDFLLEITGWRRDEILGTSWFDTFMPEFTRNQFREGFFKLFTEHAGPDDLHKVTIIQTKSGEQRTVSWNTTILRDSTEEIIGLTCFGEDISERIQAEEVLKRYQLLFEHANDIILFFRRDGKILEANTAAVNTYGYSREQLLTMNVSDLRAEQTKALLAGQIDRAEQAGLLYETVHQLSDGKIMPVEVSLQGTVLEHEKVLLGIVRDITDRKRAEETINYLAYHDPLTELPNRVLFFDRLTVALANAKRNKQKLAVMFLDLDRFKLVNDIMGHAMGDQFLKKVGKQLKSCVRSNDTVARVGGDEFTILLPDISRDEDTVKVAKKIIHGLKKPWILNGYEFQITVSVGIVLYPNDGEDAETLTKNADTAMYRAKEQGDNYQFYTPAMNLKNVQRMEIEVALRKALENEEFQIYYQPQVNISKGMIVGFEALLRWNHPLKGVILPMEFISVAEDTGLIIPIGEWVLKTACAQNKAWQDAGYPPVRISVNLSAHQFRQRNLVDMVAAILVETGLEPKWLELELTESTAMQDVEFSLVMMKKLREMGIRIAMDDFGTGYSSLGYLRKFPLTTLKIDRSFVHDVLTDLEDAAIVATIIVMAQNLKLNVIIEGVESEEQLAFFEQQECYEMQGYLFSKPEHADVTEKMLQKQTAFKVSI